MAGLRVFTILYIEKKKKIYIYIGVYGKWRKPDTTRHGKGEQMKQDFTKLEDAAIDGRLNYENFPPAEYKYFSKLAKLGYNNRHKGWTVETCELKQEEYKKQYFEEKKKQNEYADLSKHILNNLLAASELVRKLYKTDDVTHTALQIVELLTNETGLTSRIEKKLNSTT